MQASIEAKGPVYFRITRFTPPVLFGDDHHFEWGKGVILRPGRDVTLFGTGMMSSLCLQAADLLVAEGINAEVIHLASIKPIDEQLIIDSVSRTGCAVTAENGTIMGGFGSAVSEVVAESFPVHLKRIGVRDQWVVSGGIQELFTHHGMRSDDIADAARIALQEKEKRHI
jgi:transketolase